MTNSVVSDIKSRLNIVDYIGQYLRLQKAGANWKALCPFHNEKTPSFMVNEEKQIWHCFGCGRGGDIFEFLMQMEGLEFEEALKILAEKAGVELSKRRKSEKKIFDKEKILEILELAAKFYEVQLWQGMGKEKILSYLKEKRGLTEEIIRKFRLGYAPPGWRNIFSFLIERGYASEEIMQTGLLVRKDLNEVSVSSSISEKMLSKDNAELSVKDNYAEESKQRPPFYDRFRHRIIFPIADAMGRIIGFSARVAPGGDESQAKYINTPETAVYHKSQVLFGLDKSKKKIKEQDEAILVEGNLDVIAAFQAGIENVVAVSGTALTNEQLDILKRYTRNIKMFFDMDEAGKSAARRSSELAFRKDFNVYLVESDLGKDAAEVVFKNKKGFLDALHKAKPAMELFLAEIFASFDENDPVSQKNAVQEALEVIGNLSSEIEKRYWLKRVAERSSVEIKTLLDLLRRMTPGKKEVESIEDKTFSLGRDRMEIIFQKMIGLMLASPSVWRQAVKEFSEHAELEKNEDICMLLDKGGEINFNSDEFFAIIESESKLNLFRRLYFENRFQFSESGKTEAVDEEKALSFFVQCLNELKKEMKKKRLKELWEDIRKAEKQQDKESLKLLMDEFNNLSKQVD